MANELLIKHILDPDTATTVYTAQSEDPNGITDLDIHVLNSNNLPAALDIAVLPAGQDILSTSNYIEKNYTIKPRDSYRRSNFALMPGDRLIVQSTTSIVVRINRTIDKTVNIASGGPAFYPSSYHSETIATTTAAGQSDVVATGASRLRVVNLDSTNNLRVAFGTSAEDAEANVAFGVIVLSKSVDLIGIPANATHYAWLAVTANVSMQIYQGV